MNYPLSLNTWNKKEKKAIQDVINSNHFTMGKKVIEFEKKFAKKFNSKYAVMVNSGSSANLLILNIFYCQKQDLNSLKYLNRRLSYQPYSKN